MDGLTTGDWIRVSCKDPTIDPSLNKTRVFEGEVISIFNAVQKDGSDYWVIEIKGPVTWFMWHPSKDGGSFEHVPRKYQWAFD